MVKHTGVSIPNVFTAQILQTMLGISIVTILTQYGIAELIVIVDVYPRLYVRCICRIRNDIFFISNIYKYIQHIYYHRSYDMSLTYDDFEKMYRDEHGDIPEFNYICKKDLGILDNPKADKLMWIAWEFGHSDGYYAVYQKAQDMVELIL
jgi:hypothetical protein